MVSGGILHLVIQNKSMYLCDDLGALCVITRLQLGRATQQRNLDLFVFREKQQLRLHILALSNLKLTEEVELLLCCG